MQYIHDIEVDIKMAEEEKRRGKSAKGEYKDKELSLNRSNRLIQGKDNLRTVNQRKVLAYALAISRLDETGNPVAEFPVGDLTEYKGMDKKNISRTFRQMQENPDINRTIVIPAKDKRGGFELIGMIDSLKYDPDKGRVKVRFTQAIGSHIFDISEGYTRNAISKLFLFRHTSSYRIYELLSIREYALRDHENVYITYDLCELKQILGLVQEKHGHLEKRLRNRLKRQPSARELFEEYPECEPYPSWTDFRRYVLEDARKEFHMLSDAGEEIFTFDYEPIKRAKGKVVAVKFTIIPPALQRSHEFSDADTITAATQDGTVEVVGYSGAPQERADPVIMDKIREIFINGEPLTDKNIYDIQKAAGGNLERIKKAYILMRQQDGIRNTVGWIIKAIQEDYDEGFPSDKRFDYEGAKRAKDLYEKYVAGKTESGDGTQKPVNSSTICTPQTLYEMLEKMRMDGLLNRRSLGSFREHICVAEEGQEIIYAKECLSLVWKYVYEKDIANSELLRILNKNGFNVIQSIFSYEEDADDTADITSQ